VNSSQIFDSPNINLTTSNSHLQNPRWKSSKIWQQDRSSGQRYLC